jgi:excisionase family DNA binding protein
VGARSTVKEPMMTMAEMAAFLNVHPVSITRMIRRGELPGIKIGGVWRFDRQVIAKWLKDKEQGGTTTDGEI